MHPISNLLKNTILMKKNLSYVDLVHHRTQANPCLGSLVEYLVKVPRYKSKVFLLDIPRTPHSLLQPVEIGEEEVFRISQYDPLVSTRIVLVENINSQLISELGEAFDIDPLFFASHVITHFEDIEKAPLPPSLAILPSAAAEKGYLNIHYQQVLDLGSSDTFKDAAYSLASVSNTPRNVRRLPSLSGRQLGLARGCCSMIVKTTKNIATCFVLVDPPITQIQDGLQRVYPAKRLHGGIEDFEQSASFSSFTSKESANEWNNSSILTCLLLYYGTNPSILQHFPTTILALAHYPVRIILSEWNVYASLISRYTKYYEYSMNDITHRLHNDDIIDLQRWRRRSQQSQQKLTVLAEFIDFWQDEEREKKRWSLVIKDIRHLQRQMELYSLSLEQMVTAATSMIQILDSRRSIVEAIHVRRLTYIALIFIPLSWVASLFSMGEGFLPGQEFFWVYFAVGLPLVILVLILSAAPYYDLSLLRKIRK